MALFYKKAISVISLLIFVVTFVLFLCVIYTAFVKGLNSVQSGDTNLTIWDTTDSGLKNINEAIYFYANYTNITSTISINGSNINCTFSENSTGSWSEAINITFSNTLSLYLYNKSFTKVNISYFNISCIDTTGGYNNLSVIDRFQVGWINLTIILTTNLTTNGTNITIYGHINLSDGSNVTETNISIYLNGTKLYYNETDNLLVILITPNSTRTDLYGNYNYTFKSPSSDGKFEIVVNLTYSGIFSTLSKNITVDAIKPSINLNAPIDNYNTTSFSINFNWTAIDNLDRNLTCNLTINGTLNVTNITVTNGTHYNRIVTGFNGGEYYWNVTCWDSVNNVNISETRKFTILQYATLTAWDDSDSKTIFVNYSQFYANYTNITSGISINGSGVWCQFSHNKVGRWTNAINMTFNPNTLLYELIADGKYNSMMESQERWELIPNHTATIPVGNYSFNTSCFDSVYSYNNMSVLNSISVSSYPTNLTIFDQETDTEQHPLSNDDAVFVGEQTYFYANYSTTNNAPIGLIIWNISADWEVYSVEADDINNDGLIEIVVGRRSGNIFVYNSTGGLLYNRTVGSDNPYDLEIVDLDSNGKKEIVYGDSYNNLAILNSTLGIINKTSVGSTFQAVRTIEIGDVNRDAYKEVVIGTSTGIDELRLYNFSTLNLSLLWSYNFSQGIGSNGIDLADVNNDGFIDIIAGSENGKVMVFNNSDNRTLWNVSTGNIVYAVEADDINNDGLTETVVGRHSGDVLIYNSTGGQLYTNSNVGSGFVYDLEIVDLDEDGNKEIVYGDGGGNLVILNSTLRIINKTTVENGVRTIETGDINNDGYKEVIISSGSVGSSNKLLVYNFNNSIPSLVRSWSYDVNDSIYSHAIDLADINNDGILDIIVGSEDYSVGVLQDVKCQISFNSSAYTDMSYDNNLKLWKYNRTFSDSGTYWYNMSCNKNGYTPQIQQSNITIQSDIGTPNITLHKPLNNYNTSVSSIEFNWTVTDDVTNSLTCNLTINGTVNVSNIAVTNGTPYNLTVRGFINGAYNWNVSCWDIEGNLNFSETRKFTVLPLPELNITSVNYSNIYSNETLVLNITVKNQGSANATNVNVSCYFDNTIFYSYIVNISVNSSNNSICSKTINSGEGGSNYSVKIAVDPDGAIYEDFKSNNNFTAYINIIQLTTLETEKSGYFLVNNITYFYANWTRDNNNATVSSTLAKNWILAMSNVHAVEAEDINADNLIEIIFDQPYKDIFVYNSTGGLLYNISDVTLQNSPYDIEIADLNNDGKKEVVYGDIGRNLVILNSTLRIIDNITIGNFISENETGNLVHTIEVGDVNNDSYKEIIVGTQKGTDSNLRVYNASNLTLRLLWSYNFSDSIYFHALDLADVNNDSILDIIVGSVDNTVRVFNGSNNATLWNVSTGKGVYSVEAEDINNDGLPEIVVGRANGTVFVYNSTGGLLYSNTNLGTGAPYKLKIADLDNNGQKEIIYSDNKSNLVILNSTLSILDNLTQTANQSASSTIEVGDINNDNYKEIALGIKGLLPTSNELRVYNAFALNLTLLWSYDLGHSIQYHALDLADIDNDGILDIVAGADATNNSILVTKLETCKILFNDSSTWKAMHYNNTNGKYYYNRTFSLHGNYSYNISCSRTFFEEQKYYNSFVIPDPRPSITIHAPVDNYNTLLNSVEFNWTVTDDVANSLTCNLTINGTVNVSNIAVTNGTPYNLTVTGFSKGAHYWNVSCVDGDGNFSTSATRRFGTGNIAPSVIVLEPDGINDFADKSFVIEWVSDDADNTSLTFSLYYDTILSGTSNTIITNLTDLSANCNGTDATCNYTWNTTTVISGSYFLRIVADDSITITSNNSGVININHGFSNCLEYDNNQTLCILAGCVYEPDVNICKPDFSKMSCNDVCDACITQLECQNSNLNCLWDIVYSHCYTNFSAFSYGFGGITNSSGFFDFIPYDCKAQPDKCDSQYDPILNFDNFETFCFDSVDNDRDGGIDCQDSDCRLWAVCGYNSSEDTIPPKIKNYEVKAFSDMFDVFWSTTEPTNGSILFYNIEPTCASLNRTVKEGDFANCNLDDYFVWHHLIVDSLNPNTIYYFKIVDYDQAGLVSISGCLNVTTTPQDSMFKLGFDAQMNIDFDFGSGFQPYDFTSPQSMQKRTDAKLRFADKDVTFCNVDLVKPKNFNLTNTFEEGTDQYGRKFIGMRSNNFLELAQNLGLSGPDNITITISATGNRVYKCTGTGTDCIELTSCVKIVSANSTHTTIAIPVALGFSSYTVGDNGKLSIWDEIDQNMPFGGKTKYQNQQIKFFANYSNLTSGSAITGASCVINFTDLNAQMSWNSSSTFYDYNRSFSSTGTFSWNVTCLHASFDTLTTNDTVTVSVETTTPSSTPSGGGGGGGGGGGAVTIISKNVRTKTWFKVNKGDQLIWEIPSFTITYIKADVRQDDSNAKITITLLDKKPDEVSEAENSYQYILITYENLDVGDVTTGFRVNNTWSNSREIVLSKYTNRWIDLPIKYLSGNIDYSYYEANPPGLSYFAIRSKAIEIPKVEDKNITEKQKIPTDIEIIEKIREPPKVRIIKTDKKRKIRLLIYLISSAFVFLIVIILILLLIKHKYEEMPTYKLKRYVKLALKAGMGKEEVIKNLLSVGWNIKIVQKILKWKNNFRRR